MLLMTPLFGWISSRWPRRKFLPGVYGFFILNLLFFYFAMNSDVTGQNRTSRPSFLYLGVGVQLFCRQRVLVGS